MSRDSASAAFCRVDDQFELIQGERGLGFAVRSPAEISVDLDPVGAPADLITNNARQAVDSIGFLGALRNAPLGSKTLRGIAARCHDGARDGEHARTRNDA